jgi:hypothetical protein
MTGGRASAVFGETLRRHLCLSRGPVGWMPRLVGGGESRLYNRVYISRKLPTLWVGSFTAETKYLESDLAVPQARVPIRLKIRRLGVRRRPRGSDATRD